MTARATGAAMGRALSAVPAFWVPWARGPVRAPDGPVVVSITEFVPHSPRHFPAFALDGLRLREGWYGMEGAVGLFLYAQPTRNRGGSVSVWSSDRAMRRFIGLPRHVEIMRTYRPLGVVRSVTWDRERFDRDEVKRHALAWLNGFEPPGARQRPQRRPDAASSISG